MGSVLTIRDETTGGKITGKISLDFLKERITVQELIRERVYQEVQDYNNKPADCFKGLVCPTGAEETLNGFRRKERKKIDWKKQFEKATEAFESNRILILIDEKQAESLDEEFTILSKTEVVFLKLMLLVGG
jgi:hypothetical protein